MTIHQPQQCLVILDFRFWRARIEGRALSKRNEQIDFLTILDICNIIWVMYLKHHISLTWFCDISKRFPSYTTYWGETILWTSTTFQESKRIQRRQVNFEGNKTTSLLEFHPPHFCKLVVVNHKLERQTQSSYESYRVANYQTKPGVNVVNQVDLNDS